VLVFILQSTAVRKVLETVASLLKLRKGVMVFENFATTVHISLKGTPSGPSFGVLETARVRNSEV